MFGRVERLADRLSREVTADWANSNYLDPVASTDPPLYCPPCGAISSANTVGALDIDIDGKLAHGMHVDIPNGLFEAIELIPERCEPLKGRRCRPVGMQ